jgi:hypothetical protein
MFSFLNGAATISDCGNDSLFKITELSLSPPIAAVGQKTVLYMSYVVPENTYITYGTAMFSITLNGLPFSPTIEPLCSQLPCPILGGKYTNNTDILWPDISGKFTTTMSWYDENNTELLCFEITAKI